MKRSLRRSAPPRRYTKIGASRSWSFSSTVATTGAPEIGLPSGAVCAPANYVLPGFFPARKQASSETAWATIAAILLSWRDDKPYTETQAAEKLGAQWSERLASGRALTDDETALYLGCVGVCTPPPQLLSSEAWEALLRLYGPLAIFGGDVSGVKLPARGRVVFGVRGDGTMSGTLLKLVDTTTGTVDEASLESLGGPYRLVHFHADAGLGCGVKPTAPAPAPAGAPAPTAGVNGTGPTPATTPTAAEARASSRRIYTRQASTPDWDRPENFPAQIRAFWADPNSRLHHSLWHTARSFWPDLPDATKKEILKLGFTAPPRLSGLPAQPGQPGRTADAGAGVDFLNMHRQMVNATRSLAISLGIPYRPLAWDPIPWVHDDPIWPMPTFSGSQFMDSKAPDRTVYWKRMVDQTLRNDKWLTSVSLDQLGTTLEEGIHNWMHMHWSGPRPTEEEARRTDPSADYLGSTFSSQVNPAFWKLHGWIDECIERWENAPLSSGGAKRSAASVLASFAWFGPVPKAPTAAAKSMDLHEHGLDLSEADVQRVLGMIQPFVDKAFPFADLPKPDLVARFGDVGPITVAELQEIEPPRSQMASLYRPRQRRVVVGYERHGVRTMDVIDDVVGKIEDLGKSIFNKLTDRPNEGRYSVQSDIAQNVHKDTPAKLPYTKTSADFMFTAKGPSRDVDDLVRGRGEGAKDYHFKLTLEFKHNGFDIRDARVVRLDQESTGLEDQLFSVRFNAKEATPDVTEVAKIAFLFEGKWDPNVKEKTWDFMGEIDIDARGNETISLRPVENDMVKIDTTTPFTNIRHEAMPTPAWVMEIQTVFFSPPGSDTITDQELQRFKDWVRGLQTNELRYHRLRDGTLAIHVDGYASPTGKGQMNQDLSKKRAKKVVDLVRAEFGSAAKIVDAWHGERNPGDKKEEEDELERRADIWFEIVQ